MSDKKLFDPSDLNIDFGESSIDATKSDENTSAPKANPPKENLVTATPVKKDPIGEISIMLEEENPEEIVEEIILEEVVEEKKQEEDKTHKYVSVAEDKTENIVVSEEKKNDILEGLGTILTDSELRPEEIKQKDIQKKEQQNNKKIEEAENIVYDINISKADDILKVLIKEDYDLFHLEPFDNYAKVIFKQGDVIKKVLYLRYVVYSKILLQLKTISGLNLSLIDKEQKGQSNYKLGDDGLEILSKTKPSDLGEKLYLKARKKKNVAKKKTTKKPLSPAKIFAWFGSILLILLILFGAFFTFIVLNAKEEADIIIFKQLFGLEIRDINNFIKNSILVIFSILAFLECIILIIFSFKAILTKKVQKTKKAKNVILSIFMFIVLVSTMSLGLFLYKYKLEDWGALSLGSIQVYDNDNLIRGGGLSGNDLKRRAKLTSTSNLIGPVTIMYDLSNFKNEKARQGFVINKFIWSFGKQGDKIEKSEATIIHTFDEIGIYDLSLTVEGKENGEFKSLNVDQIESVEISYLVDIKEVLGSTGGKTVSFDATGLKERGKVSWYMKDENGEYNVGDDEDNKKKTFSEGYKFSPGKTFFEDEVIIMKVEKDSDKGNALYKDFLITAQAEATILGKINYKTNPVNDLKKSFYLSDMNTDFGSGFIENIVWSIDGKTINKKISKIANSDADKLLEESKIDYTFKTYGNKKVSVTLTNTLGSQKELSLDINIKKELKIKEPLTFLDSNGEKINTVEYDKDTNNYYLYNLGVPSKITFDTKLLKIDNPLYRLNSVSWDMDADGNIDNTEKKPTFDLDLEKTYEINVEYTFKKLGKSGDTKSIKETITIEGVKKEALLNLKIEKESEYVPVVVKFDASESSIKSDNIVKFIYDYGDGIIKEGDSINLGHKYSRPGDYDIKLTVVTEKGKKYSINKKLILKPKPEEVSITVSMKETKVNGGIDFSSENSIGQIRTYLWKFGDGNISQDANPSHRYKKPGKYKVELECEFYDRNIKKDIVEILVTE